MTPIKCNACSEPLLLANLYVDDGCPCNSPRGVNFPPEKCGECRTNDCVKPGHKHSVLFGPVLEFERRRKPDAP